MAAADTEPPHGGLKSVAERLMHDLTIRPPKGLFGHIKGVFGCAALVSFAPIFAVSYQACFVLTLPLPSRVMTAIDGWLYAQYQRLTMFVMRDMAHTKYILHGDLPRAEDNVILVSNHQCTVDWLVAHTVAEAVNGIGRVRFILKNSLKFIPLYGWYWRLHGFIYVRKSWSDDADRLRDRLQQLNDSGLPYWVVLYPEGTRIKPSKLRESHEFAQQRELETLHYTLIPRSKGFSAAANCLRTSCNAIYDITVAYKAKDESHDRFGAPSMFDMVGQHFNEVHVHIERIPIEQVPESYAEADAWLKAQFRKKDRLLEKFHQGEMFPGPTKTVEESNWVIANRVLCYTTLLGLFYGTKLGRRVVLGELFVGGVLGTILSAALL
eukprot:m.46777 g.46777  ORF g.46777 m.46777 type:complete len:380 (-) comp10941_c0_seq3:314-1453(-)